jgi:prolyl-tRNA synthetase
LGPRDIENGVATVMRRDTLEKSTLPLDGITDALKALLDDIHLTLYRQADEFRLAHTYTATDMDELTKGVQDGFVRAAWCGEQACEDKIKELTNATSRNMPFDQSGMPSETCVCCGKPAKHLMYFAKAY